MTALIDVVILVADGAMSEVVTTILPQRRRSLQVRDLTFEILKDALHDASAETNAVNLLRGYLRTHAHALVVRDLAGSGWEDKGPRELEKSLVTALTQNGWQASQVAALVIDPEIEAWLRFDSIHLQQLIKDRARRNQRATDLLFNQQLRRILDVEGRLASGKPRLPKEAFERLLQEFGIPRSNALYGELARKESLDDCSAPSFNRFKRVLRAWFPAAS